MKFQIDFNWDEDNNDDVLEMLGCKREEHYGEQIYTLNIEEMIDLKILQDKVNTLCQRNYALVIDMDMLPIIYFDDQF